MNDKYLNFQSDITCPRANKNKGEACSTFPAC